MDTRLANKFICLCFFNRSQIDLKLIQNYAFLQKYNNFYFLQSSLQCFRMPPRKNHDSDAILKILVIGDSGVGKTNLITRYSGNQFNQSYVATIGIDFKIRKFKFDNFSLRLQIWDTAGQERFRNITNTFYKGAAGILVAFSIVDQVSFQNVSSWIKQINNNASEGVSKLLVGTKADLDSQRKVNRIQVQTLAKKHNMKYVQVSAKTGMNVDQCFRSLVIEIKQKYDELDQPIFSSNGVHIKNNLNMNDNKKCAC